MKHSTFNIQQRTSKADGTQAVLSVECWALNVECFQFRL